MKTLDQIREEVYQKKGYSMHKDIDLVVDEVAKLFAIEVAKEALKNADKRVGMFPNYRNLVQDKILNETNIPKL